MRLQEGIDLANDLIKEIGSYCKRIEIAGSIRRQKPEVHDIEIVAIPDGGHLIELSDWERRHYIRKGGLPGKMTYIVYGGQKVDIFYAREENFGNIFVIRTGSKEFNVKLMERIESVGLLHKDGYLWKIKGIGQYEKLVCPDEETFFKYLGMAWFKPELRG